jgi:hypothetical protein
MPEYEAYLAGNDEDSSVHDRFFEDKEIKALSDPRRICSYRILDQSILK